MVIETTTFRLRADTDEAAFLAADERAQTEVAYALPGLLRRTTARGADGEWLVVTLWSDASAGSVLASDHVDAGSVTTRTWSTLD